MYQCHYLNSVNTVYTALILKKKATVVDINLYTLDKKNEVTCKCSR